MAQQSQKDTAFFEKPFDDVTQLKLDIYAEYLQEWLPVPLSGRMRASEAVIYDLLCGPGCDCNGVPGSPLRARDVIVANAETILGSTTSVRLVLNDYLADHIAKLERVVGDHIATPDGRVLARVEYSDRPFELLFPELVASIDKKAANMLFIDQFGATDVDEDVFRAIYSLKRTDVLFFVSSNWFRRFSGRPESANWNIDETEIKRIDYNRIHQFVAEHFKALVGGEYYVAPFSLKKGANIYGLVFASHNHRGIEKFLKVAWKHDPHTGAANYDIDHDGQTDDGQLQMFEARKISAYQSELREKVLDGDFKSDRDIYLHMLQRGFINKHTKPVVRNLVADGKVEFRLAGKRVQARISSPSFTEPRQLLLL